VNNTAGTITAAVAVETPPTTKAAVIRIDQSTQMVAMVFVSIDIVSGFLSGSQFVSAGAFLGTATPTL